MNVALTINKILIPLPEGISLPLVLRNPLFCLDGNFPGSFVFNTTLPATDALRQAVGNPHRVNRHGRATGEYDYVLTHGILRYEGKCTVTEADANSYEVSLNVDNGDFYASLKNKSLKDLNLGGDRNSLTVYSSASESEDWHDDYITDNPAFYDQPLVMNTEMIDVNNALDIFNGEYTAPTTGVYRFYSFLDAHLYQDTTLRIYVNDILRTELPISEGTNELIDGSINLTENDKVKIYLYAESVPLSGFYAVEFIIRAGSYYEISLPNAFTDLINSANDNQDNSDFAIFPIQNAKFLDAFPDDAFILDNISIKTLYSEYFTVLNYFKEGRFPTFMYGTKDGESFTAANLFTPFPYVKYLITKIATEAGYTLTNSPFDYVSEGQHPVTDFKGMVLFNAYAENVAASSVPNLIPVKTTFNLIDHVPDMNQGEFLKQVCLLTGYLPVVDNQLKTITFIHLPDSFNDPMIFPGTVIVNPLVTVKPEYKGIIFSIKEPSADGYMPSRIHLLASTMVLKGSVTSIDDLPDSGNVVNDCYLVTDENMYYVWQYDPETYTIHWCFYSRNFFLEKSESDEPYLEISPELAPMLMITRLDNTLGATANRYWKIPVTEQPGILEGYPLSQESKYGFQFLIYLGMKTDSLNQNYPYATSELYAYEGDAEDIAHQMDAPGIYANHWQTWLEWLAYDAKPVKFYARLTPAQLRALSIHKPQRLPDGSTVMIQELDVSLQRDGLSVAEIKAYTV